MRKLFLALWVALVAAAAILSMQPVGTAVQWTVSLLGLGVMLAISVLKFGGVFRQLFFVTGFALVARYVFWRATSTLPSPELGIDFVAGAVLFAAELFCIVMLLVNLFVIANPINRRRPIPPRDADLPTVDVFVPSLNESAELLGITLAAAKAMDYPRDKLAVYLLDDGGTDEKVNSPDARIAHKAGERRSALQRLCAELGVSYVTRARNVQAKAGNLTNGLAQSQGELIAVFDADHAPARDFLRETVGFFPEDRRLFLVQTPHFFLNPDPIEKNLSTFDRMPSENEMFYGVIQKGLDRWNSAFFCGSAAVLRRSALEEVGGFSGTSITEDCETALDLHARGWNSVYVDKPLIAGLQPETFHSFIGQRSRWCRGMLQIQLTKNPLLKRGLTGAQRLCYTASSMFWLFPIPRLVFLLAPLAYIFFDLKIYDSTVNEFFAYTVAYILAAIMLQGYTYGRYRWPWISELYEYVQSVYLFPAVLSVIRNPRRPTFNVTAKGTTTDDDHLSGLALPYILIFLVLCAGVLVTALRLEHDAEPSGLLLIVGFWNLFNLVIAGVALGVVCERRERRRAPRVPVRRRGDLVIDGSTFPLLVEDVSHGGLRAQLLGQPSQPLRGRQSGRLEVHGARRDSRPIALPCTVVTSKLTEGGTQLSLAFEGLTPSHYAGLAELMYADLDVVRDQRASRQRRRMILWASVQTVAWSLRYALRCAHFALFRRAGGRGSPADASA